MSTDFPRELRQFAAGVRIAAAQQEGLTLSQLAVVLEVAQHPGQSMTEVGEAIDMELATLSRNVDVLGTAGRRDGKGPRRGLLEVRADPADDRRKLLYLTAAGTRFLIVVRNVLSNARFP